MIRCAIFDMDGLMFDTELLFLRAMQEYVGPETGVEFPTENILKLLGCNQKDFDRLFPILFGTAITPQKCTELVTFWMRREIETHGMPTKPGLYALLDALKAKGFRLALATGTSRPIALAYLEQTHTRHYFDTIVCGDQVRRGKPDPEIFETAFRLLGGGDPKTCVVFEDSPNGLKAAHAAGFLEICVPDMIDPTLQLSFTPFAKLASLDEAIPLLCEER